MLWTATAVTGGRCRPVSGYPRYNDIMYGVEHRAQMEMLEWWEMNRETPAMGVDLATRSRTGA